MFPDSGGLGGEQRNERFMKTAADRKVYENSSGPYKPREGSCGTKLERRGMPYEKSQILGMGCGDLYDFNDLHGI